MNSHCEDDFPAEGRIAAVDFGTVRIGIAICDPDRILASPYEIRSVQQWKNSQWQLDADYYRSLVKNERVVAFIVGLPIHLDGGENLKSKECREFAKWLMIETQVPVRLFDERFTTADATNRMRPAGYSKKAKKQRVDAIAAFVLLESFIEACRYRGEIVGEPADNDAPNSGEAID